MVDGSVWNWNRASPILVKFYWNKVADGKSKSVGGISDVRYIASLDEEKGAYGVDNGHTR